MTKTNPSTRTAPASVFYLLDTNAVIDAIRQKFSMSARLASMSPDEIGIPSMALAELEFGVLRADDRRASRRSTDRIIAELRVVPFGREAATIHAGLRRELQRSQIGGYDLIIAATAIACGAVLVTSDTAEFSRVPGLTIENWRES